MNIKFKIKETPEEALEIILEKRKKIEKGGVGSEFQIEKKDNGFLLTSYTGKFYAVFRENNESYLTYRGGATSCFVHAPFGVAHF